MTTIRPRRPIGRATRPDDGRRRGTIAAGMVDGMILGMTETPGSTAAGMVLRGTTADGTEAGMQGGTTTIVHITMVAGMALATGVVLWFTEALAEACMPIAT